MKKLFLVFLLLPCLLAAQQIDSIPVFYVADSKIVQGDGFSFFYDLDAKILPSKFSANAKKTAVLFNSNGAHVGGVKMPAARQGAKMPSPKAAYWLATRVTGGLYVAVNCDGSRFKPRAARAAQAAAMPDSSFYMVKKTSVLWLDTIGFFLESAKTPITLDQFTHQLNKDYYIFTFRGELMNLNAAITTPLNPEELSANLAIYNAAVSAGLPFYVARLKNRIGEDIRKANAEMPLFLRN